ncbi:MAG: hypothetical protein ACRDQF_18615, partial [Thermocrispum sp.]
MSERRLRRPRPRRRLLLGVLAAAGVTAALVAAPAGAAPTPSLSTLQLVEVSTPTQADKARLAALPLDLTEAGGKDHVDVLLHGPAQG